MFPHLPGIKPDVHDCDSTHFGHVASQASTQSAPVIDLVTRLGHGGQTCQQLYCFLSTNSLKASFPADFALKVIIR